MNNNITCALFLFPGNYRNETKKSRKRYWETYPGKKDQKNMFKNLFLITDFRNLCDENGLLLFL